MNYMCTPNTRWLRQEGRLFVGVSEPHQQAGAPLLPGSAVAPRERGQGYPNRRPSSQNPALSPPHRFLHLGVWAVAVCVIHPQTLGKQHPEPAPILSSQCHSKQPTIYWQVRCCLSQLSEDQGLGGVRLRKHECNSPGQEAEDVQTPLSAPGHQSDRHSRVGGSTGCSGT